MLVLRLGGARSRDAPLFDGLGRGLVAPFGLDWLNTTSRLLLRLPSAILISAKHRICSVLTFWPRSANALTTRAGVMG